MIKAVRCLLLACCLLLLARQVLAAYPQNPLLIDDSIYVSQQGVYKFQLNQSAPAWSSLVGIETFAPVIDGGLLLVGSTQGLYALHPDSGKVAWHIEKQRTIFTPALSTQAFAGSVHGELYSIDAGLGQILWRRAFSGWIYSPAINEVSGRLWTGGQDHMIYALSLADGSQVVELPTTQELVFSPVDLGNNRIGVNLFDGSTLVIDAAAASIEAVLAGGSQPTGLRRQGKGIYRSHRDGNLDAFDFGKLAPSWRQSITAQDLTIHPSQPGYLLLSNGDRQLSLLDLKHHDSPCRIDSDGSWILPIQITEGGIVLFQRSMQPPRIKLVQIRAQCK